MVVYTNTDKLKEKIINKEQLNEDEVAYICLKEPFEVVDSFYAKDAKDLRTFRKILKIEDDYYSLYHYKERHIYEETVYPPQTAIKVIPVEVTETVWVASNKSN